jgi:hypothetical protein
MKLKSHIAISETGFIFDSATGDSYNLNQTAKVFIDLLVSGKSENEILDTITERYDVNRLTAEHNYHDLLAVLRTFNLLTEN